MGENTSIAVAAEVEGRWRCGSAAEVVGAERGR